MASDLITSEANLPGRHDEAIAGLGKAVDAFYGAIHREGGRDTLANLPAPQVRERMRERQIALRTVLRPISMAMADRDAAMRAIAGLLGGYPNLRTVDPIATAAGYTATCAEYPVFAIIAACDDFKNRRVVDHYEDNGQAVMFTLDHAPSAYRLLDQVKLRAADLQSESYKIGRVLAITKATSRPVISKAEQDRVAAGLQALAAHMAGKADEAQKAHLKELRENAQAARDRAARITENARRQREAAATDGYEEMRTS
jgi:hypothetical protein